MLSEKIPPSELIILPDTIPIFNKIKSGFKSELYSPENFVKEPIFFDSKELILKDRQNLSTSFRNNNNVFSITNKGNDDNYYFDIVRSPKLPPEPYVPPVNKMDTPAETITNGQPITPGRVTQTTSQSK